MKASFRKTTCAKCSEPLIALEWSEYVNQESVVNLWQCTKCGYQFETEACMPFDSKADALAIKDFFRSLLVA
jgi:ABC-type ATPase with predicted acetyltransferase domain